MPSTQEIAARYEELRRIGLAGQKVAQNLGLALFLHRGMAAWMKAWENYCPLKRPAKASNQNIPAATQNTMVMLLVSMIFSSKEEVLI